MNMKINMLIMPTDICNMNCVYCFHNSHHQGRGRMSLETLKRLYDISFPFFNDVLIIWHGGEPLCMGQPFFESAFCMQQCYPSVKIVNRMQSNLSLLTDEMADFLCKNKVSVGTSFDGVNNDMLRGNSERILAGREKIISRGMGCGFIMVLSKLNIDTLIESYELFKNLNANYTINTYVATDSPKDDALRLDADEAILRLKTFYDYWINDRDCNIRVDLFERMIRFLFKGEKSVCKYTSCLGRWVGIRYDGSIVPCNRYFPSDYSMGNIWDYTDISDAFKSEGFRLLLTEAVARRYKCQNCFAFPYCSGGCNNVALNETGIQENGGTTCRITKSIYSYVSKHISYVRNHPESWKTLNPSIRRIAYRGRNNNARTHQDIHIDTTL